MKLRGSQSVMYLAHPTRVWKNGGSDRIVAFARKKGFAPINPFLCGDFQDFEGGIVGREGTLQWTLHLQRGCHWSGYFGISEGVMQELKDRLKWDKDRKMRVFYEDENGVPFDDKWQEEYENLQNKHGDLLAELRGKNRLIALVGPSAVGKTYWIERLMKRHENSLQRVKNTTTRPPRDKNDESYYHIISPDVFQERISQNDFLEHDQYLRNHYGSSLSEMRKVLATHNGIFAMTPNGAKELFKCRFEVNISVILMKPKDDSVLIKNFDRRGEKNQVRRNESLQKVKDFVLPSHVEHHFLELTGTKEDENKIFSLFDSLLK